MSAGWLASSMVSLFKIQKNDFLHWSNAFLMILSLRGAPIGVWLIDFHLFSVLKSIFKKISLRSIWIKQEAVNFGEKLIFVNIDLGNENKWKLINITSNWSSRKLKIVKKALDQCKKTFFWILNKWPASRPVSQPTLCWSASKWAGLQPQHNRPTAAFVAEYILHTCSRNTTNLQPGSTYFAHVFEKYNESAARKRVLCTRAREIRRFRSLP